VPSADRKRGSGGRRIAVVAIAAAAVVTFSLFVVRRNGAGPCASIRTELTAPDEWRTAPLVRSELVVSQTSIGTFSSSPSSPFVMAVNTGGDVVVAAPYQNGSPTYRRARLTDASVDALRRCVESPSFQGLAAAYPDPAVSAVTCGVADAATTRIVAGATSGSSKSVSAYALGSARGECAPPAALSDLHTALVGIRDAVAENGLPTGPPEI